MGALNNYFRLMKYKALLSLYRFFDAVVKVLEEQFFRAPCQNEKVLLLYRAEHFGVRGILGFINCCNWRSKGCPNAHHGQYKGKQCVPTVTVGAICNDRLCFWDVFFGMKGYNSDDTVINAFTISAKTRSETYTLPVSNEIGNIERKKPYILWDGIFSEGHWEIRQSSSGEV